MKSYKPEVKADKSGNWAGNAVRFATREEAEIWVLDRMMKWTLVYDTRVVESDDPVNYAIIDNRMVAVNRYPTLRKALELFCNDQGLSIDAVKLEDIQFDEAIKLWIVDKALEKLSKDELETICIGDQDEWEPILDKLGEDRQMVQLALEFMFESIVVGD